MSSTPMTALIEAAAEEGFGGNLTPGTYLLRVGQVKYSKNQGGNQKLGILWKVVHGPESGSVWQDLWFSPDKPKGLAFFFRKLNALGVTNDEIVAYAPTSDISRLPEIVKAKTEGKVFEVVLTIENREGTGKNKGKFYDNQEFSLPVLSDGSIPASS